MAFNFHLGELLLINKPYTWTSFQAVNKIKHGIKKHPSLFINDKFVKPKIGHAGTLDPLATGLLIVCTGKKTKTINDLMGLEKEYTGSFFIGATTPCFDMEKPKNHEYAIGHITNQFCLEIAQTFVGKQQQIPPLFSAIMIKGKRAYEYARAGEAAEIKSREIDIKEFELTTINLPNINFKIVCSKGTYIRSIARDYGLALGAGAYLSSLCRTRIGEFKLEDALTPEEFLMPINSPQGSVK
jgi:tRNA pseudouridine55 synthase